MDVRRKKLKKLARASAPKPPKVKLSDLPFGPIAEHLSMADLGRVAQTSRQLRIASLYGQVPQIDHTIAGLRGPLSGPIYGSGGQYTASDINRRKNEQPASQYDLQRNPETFLFQNLRGDDGTQLDEQDRQRVLGFEAKRRDASRNWVPKLSVEDYADYSRGGTYDEADNREAGTFKESFRFATGRDTTDYYDTYDTDEDANRLSDDISTRGGTAAFKSHRDRMYPGLMNHHAIRAKDALEQRKIYIQQILAGNTIKLNRKDAVASMKKRNEEGGERYSYGRTVPQRRAQPDPDEADPEAMLDRAELERLIREEQGFRFVD